MFEYADRGKNKIQWSFCRYLCSLIENKHLLRYPMLYLGLLTNVILNNGWFKILGADQTTTVYQVFSFSPPCWKSEFLLCFLA